jgi:hypothetical protein
LFSGLMLTGSIGAASLLSLGALFSWALASPRAVDPGSAFRTLQFLPFLLGGPGWAGFFALFLIGVARNRAISMPRWARWIGYSLSLTSGLATLVLITISAAPLLPISRFLGFIWLILITSLLFRKGNPVP